MPLIRETVMLAIHDKLKAITRANGYTREVGTERFFTESELPDNVAPPAIVLMEFDEQVLIEDFETYTCTLPISIGFIDKVRRSQDGDTAARSFMGEIQKAMGLEFAVSVESYSTGSTFSMTVQLIERQNSFTTDGQMASGDIDYDVVYNRHTKDPNKA
tara:strand:- start:227 stop:703 length:477 start_codon:yes stop_codon:yes gene_type:complete